jgi:diguanylate cyclase (GGDEF)-like protein
VARLTKLRVPLSATRYRDWALWTAPRRLRLYVVAVVGAEIVAAVLFLIWSHYGWRDALIALILLACGIVNIEGLRRIGEPSGVFADLQSVWTLPMAVLLPPVYCLLAPGILGLALQFRVKRTAPYRRVFSACAVGLSNFTAALAFRGFIGSSVTAGIPRHDWLQHAALYGALALAAGIIGAVVNEVAIASAVKMYDPESGWRELLVNRERLALNLVELSSGVVTSVVVSVNAVLVIFAMPAMLLLQRSILHGQLNAAARIDQKTGLLNAGTWNREAERELATAAHARRPVSLLVVDLDHFKLVNDQHGHLVGDEVLKSVADALAGQVRKDDLAGRFGGEEFVLLLTDTPQAEAGLIAERLRTRIAGMTVEGTDAQPVGTTVSIGIASQGRDGSDLMELLAAADTALYRAKSAGRNRTCLASDTS